jgi:hypothetical protein
MDAFISPLTDFCFTLLKLGNEQPQLSFPAKSGYPLFARII